MSKRPEDLEDVLIRFHEAVEAVTPEVIRAWTTRYPQFADAIRAEALEILDLDHGRLPHVAEPAVRDYADKVRNAAHRAAELVDPVDVPDLRGALEQHHVDVRTFAGTLGIARSIIADISTGQIVPSTIKPRFRRLGAERLGCARVWFEAVLENSQPRTMTAAFKASDFPTTGRARTWEEAIRASSMPEDRKAFWLADEA